MNAMRTMGLAPVLPSEATVSALADEYIVRLAVPGYAREELDVEVADHVVTVCGDQTDTRGDEPFRIHERVEERFRLPADADGNRATANFAHGALELHVPRNGGDSVPRKVTVEHRLEMNADASGV